MKKVFKNIVVLTNLNKECHYELLELKNSDFIMTANNVIFVHLFNDRIKDHLPVNIDSNNQDEVEAHLAKELKFLSQEIIPENENYNCQVSYLSVFHKDPKIKILELLNFLDADVVIASTRGEQGAAGIFKESFSFWLVENSPCDVFIIRPKPKKN